VFFPASLSLEFSPALKGRWILSVLLTSSLVFSFPLQTLSFNSACLFSLPPSPPNRTSVPSATSANLPRPFCPPLAAWLPNQHSLLPALLFSWSFNYELLFPRNPPFPLMIIQLGPQGVGYSAAHRLPQIPTFPRLLSLPTSRNATPYLCLPLPHIQNYPSASPFPATHPKRGGWGIGLT